MRYAWKHKMFQESHMIVLIMVIWLFCGVISAMVASSKGRSGCSWLALGVVLGPIGMIASFIVPNPELARVQEARVSGSSKGFKKCPSCAEVVRSEAIKCRFCGTDFLPAETRVPRASTVGAICNFCGSGGAQDIYGGKPICGTCSLSIER